MNDGYNDDRAGGSSQISSENKLVLSSLDESAAPSCRADAGTWSASHCKTLLIVAESRPNGESRSNG